MTMPAFLHPGLVALLLTVNLSFTPVGGAPSAPPAAVAPCDLKQGQWVADAAQPAYTGLSCPFIHDSFNCAKRGRTGPALTAYQRLRWQPRGCNLARFDPDAFGRLVGNRSVAIVGDSLATNLGASLVCLANSGAAKLVPWWERWGGTNVTFVKHPVYGTRYTTVFSPYLVSMPKKNQPELSQADPQYARWLANADIVLFHATHWYSRGHSPRYSLKGKVQKKLTDAQAYLLGMSTVAALLEKQRQKGWGGIAVLVGHAPSHSKLPAGVVVKKGSTCEALAPLTLKQAVYTARMDEAGDLIAVQQQVAAKFPIFRFADITVMTYLRIDAHVQNWAYRNGVVPKGGYDDCNHFCEAGVSDAWVDVIFDILLKEPSLGGGTPASSKTRHRA